MDVQWSYGLQFCNSGREMADPRRISHRDTYSKYRWSVAMQRRMFCTQRGRHMFCSGLQGAPHGSCPALEAAPWSSGVHIGTHIQAGDVVTPWKGVGSHVCPARKTMGATWLRNCDQAERMLCDLCEWAVRRAWSTQCLKG